MTSETEIVSIKDLSVSYDGKPILHGLNLSLIKGEICCVIGEEGCGKSTLLRSITQQLKSTGSIFYRGYDLSKLLTSEMIMHSVDFIMQGGNILREFTVEEHICLALSEKSDEEKSKIWIQISQIFPKIISMKKQIAGRLSGGERMILSMACIMATDASFLVLDEPTAGLAPETCKIIGGFLLEMKKLKSKTILLLEHNYEFAFEIADSVVTLKAGCLSEKYPPQHFKIPSFIEDKLYGK